MVSPGIFKAYDIRGTYPDQINEENIGTIVHAIYTFFLKKQNKDTLTVVLGRDMRVSSPALFEIAKEKLVSLGAQVIDVGLVSTPTFYFAVNHYGHDCGIQITASHNPKEYNGVKFVLNSKSGLIKIGKSTGMDEVKKLVSEQSSLVPDKDSGSVTENSHVLDDEVENARKLLDFPHIDPFRVVADPANAMGATFIEALFSKIGGTLIKMNFDLDGTFPAHQPDPLDFENLRDLQKRVREEKADIGLAPDGDGDRLFFIDENGEVVPASVITALVAREFLHKEPGATILFDIRYILTPQTVIKELGGKTQITKVGHAFITETMGAYNSPFAGESSAHYFYKATGNAESQVITILTVLSVLSREKKKLSEIVKELQKSYESGEINFKVEDSDRIISKLKETFSDGELSELDGISLSYPTWRFSVRTSNTEPLLRLNIEAFEKDVMEEKRDQIKSLITN